MPVIKAENLGKRYRIGQRKKEPYDTFRNMIVDSARRGIHRLTGSIETSKAEEFWALKDVSFEVNEGQRLGIIGRNGAGKSTLLKILSRITEPTEGRITMRGRVGSLLEVGTGFHPELTGRENVFLNGAVLGMSHKEIKKKFDEIVAFAEVEKFLETPVKRYSSGMYVRLAFAVAAHLEPEILIVDEVLAVGDASFQKKCLGKMDEFGRSGRTLLFVSHSMSSITQLCSRCALLQGGRLVFLGEPVEAARQYVATNELPNTSMPRRVEGTLNDRIFFESCGINGSYVSQHFLLPHETIAITVRGKCTGEVPPVRLSFALYSAGARIATCHDTFEPQPLQIGPFESEIRLPAYTLRPGEYALRVGGHDGGHLRPGKEWLFSEELLKFTVTEEWNEKNDFANRGVVNLPYEGSRRQQELSTSS